MRIATDETGPYQAIDQCGNAASSEIKSIRKLRRTQFPFMVKMAQCQQLGDTGSGPFGVKLAVMIHCPNEFACQTSDAVIDVRLIRCCAYLSLLTCHVRELNSLIAKQLDSQTFPGAQFAAREVCASRAKQLSARESHYGEQHREPRTERI